MKTIEELEKDMKYYQEIRDRAQRERRFRTVEGAQENIDRCQDKIYLLKKEK